MRRRLALVGLLGVLVALAGCGSVFGPGEPDPEELNKNATYDWDTDADTSIVVNRSSFKGVYNVTNMSTLEAYRTDGLGRDRHLPIESLRYRYPNGTIVTADSDALSVEQTRQRTVIDVPNESDGQVAFVAPRHGKQFATPVFVEGSHAVTLPPQARVGVPLLSQVDPGGYDTRVAGERMTVRWDDEVTNDRIRIRYYLQRDLYIFGGIVAVAVSVGIGGLLYYWRQIKRLERRREETGIDVDDDDDPRDRGPPPGMG